MQFSIFHLISTFGAVLASADKCVPTQSVEVYLNIDSSSSFSGYMKKARSIVPDFLTLLESKLSHLTAGMAYFGSWALAPYVDECFRQIISLTTNISEVKQPAKALEQLFSGVGDPPEESFSAMACAAGTGAGFSKPKDGDNIIR